MVDFGSVLSGLEEVHAVQVGDVHTPVREQSVHEHYTQSVPIHVHVHLFSEC